MGTEDHKGSHLMELTIEQQNAIELLLTGMSDRTVAEQVGVCRETVTKWRLYHPAFRAEMNRVRLEMWDCGQDRLRKLVPDALSALSDVINDPDNPNRWRAALEVVKLVEWPEKFASSCGPDTAQGIIEEEAGKRKTRNMFASLIEEPDADDLQEATKELEENLN